MTQEEKDLLLKDLCARLPYGVKVQTTYINQQTKKKRSDIGMDVLAPVEISMLIDGFEEHKPYLFPLSNMTEEQKEDMIKSSVGIGSDKNVFDWFNKNHFDYRGLIKKGLAIDATGLNIYINYKQ